MQVTTNPDRPRGHDKGSLGTPAPTTARLPREDLAAGFSLNQGFPLTQQG